MFFNYSHHKVLISLFIIIFTSCADVNKNNSISIGYPYAKIPMDGQDSVSAYMTINNLTNQTLSIISVSCEGANMSAFHNMILSEKDQMIRMIIEDHVNLIPNQEVIFRRGGQHLMIMGLQDSLKNKSNILCNFRLDNGEDFPFRIKLQ